MNNGQQMESKKDQTEKILRLLTKRGFIGDEDINDEKIRSAQRERQKVAYHNTELLLKQYKNIAWMIECFPDTIAEELEQPFEKVDDVINRLDIEMSLGNRKVENRLASIRKTRLVLDRINDALVCAFLRGKLSNIGSNTGSKLLSTEKGLLASQPWNGILQCRSCEKDGIFYLYKFLSSVLPSK